MGIARGRRGRGDSETVGDRRQVECRGRCGVVVDDRVAIVGGDKHATASPAGDAGGGAGPVVVGVGTVRTRRCLADDTVAADHSGRSDAPDPLVARREGRVRGHADRLVGPNGDRRRTRGWSEGRARARRGADRRRHVGPVKLPGAVLEDAVWGANLIGMTESSRLVVGERVDVVDASPVAALGRVRRVIAVEAGDAAVVARGRGVDAVAGGEARVRAVVAEGAGRVDLNGEAVGVAVGGKSRGVAAGRTRHRAGREVVVRRVEVGEVDPDSAAGGTLGGEWRGEPRLVDDAEFGGEDDGEDRRANKEAEGTPQPRHGTPTGGAAGRKGRRALQHGAISGTTRGRVKRDRTRSRGRRRLPIALTVP